MRDSQVTLTGGRQLAYTDIGERDSFCVLFFHGAPMSRLHLGYLERRLLAEGIRVVSPDRPAYGGSSPQPRRSMADWPFDVAALADALGIDRFVVAGTRRAVRMQWRALRCSRSVCWRASCLLA